jgi:hypothetical protein
MHELIEIEIVKFYLAYFFGGKALLILLAKKAFVNSGTSIINYRKGIKRRKITAKQVHSLVSSI